MHPFHRVSATVFAGVFWFFIAVGTAAQEPVRPARDAGTQTSRPTGTASITGTAVATPNGLPARKARITLTGVEPRSNRSTMTDEQGRFSFSALPAGRYTLTASKQGHLTVAYGQRQPGLGRPGTPIQLSDGQKLDARLQLPRGGVITGTLLDEHSEGTPGTQVRAMRYVTQAGQRTLQSAGAGATDDRGVYRIFGLQPGDYVVCATPRNTNAAMAADELRAEAEVVRQRAEAVARTDPAQAEALMQRAAQAMAQLPTEDTQATGYAPVCYPGTMSSSSAAAIALGVSEERSGVDFQLQLSPIATVEGTVVTPQGVGANGIQLTLVSATWDLPGLGASSSRPGSDGRFRFHNVAPGQYTLVARGTAAGRPATPGAPTPVRPDQARYWGAADISVDGRNVSNVIVTLQPGMTVSGTITFDGALAPPADMSRVRVTVTPVDVAGSARGLASPSSGTADANGRFTIANVVPGRYRLTASNAGTGWFLESSIVGGQESLDFPFEVKANQNVSGASITFGDRQSELAGRIVNADGAPATAYTIFVYAADSRYWTPGSRRMLMARPATDGGFVLRSLPAGDYRIATVIDPEPGSWTDPAFLQQLDASSMRVTIGAGEKKVQNVRVSQ